MTSEDVTKKVHELRALLKQFVYHLDQAIQLHKKGAHFVSENVLLPLANSVWTLDHFGHELLQYPIDETLKHDTMIILKVLKQKLCRKKLKCTELTSFIQASDQVKKDKELNQLQMIVSELASNRRATIVLFNDLREIAHELCA